jgi:hypothetical protein
MWTPPIAQFLCGLTAGGNLGSNTVVIESSALNVFSSRVALVDHRHQPHYGRRTLSSRTIIRVQVGYVKPAANGSVLLREAAPSNHPLQRTPETLNAGVVSRQARCRRR